jgi:SOS-response transcriptional repressor LexA
MKKANGTEYLKITDDSMEESNNKRSISKDDVIMIDSSERVKPGDIVAISLANDARMIKQYLPEKGDKVKLHSFNSNYTDIIIDKCDIVSRHKVIGVIPPVIRL